MLARQDRENEGLNVQEAIELIQELDPNISQEQARFHLSHTFIKGDTSIVKTKSVVAQYTTTKCINIMMPQQYRWHMIYESSLGELRKRNTGVCRLSGKNVGELIHFFITGGDETNLLASEDNPSIKDIGAAGRKNHEKKMADCHSSISLYQTGCVTGDRFHWFNNLPYERKDLSKRIHQHMSTQKWMYIGLSHHQDGECVHDGGRVGEDDTSCHTRASQRQQICCCEPSVVVLGDIQQFQCSPPISHSKSGAFGCQHPLSKKRVTSPMFVKHMTTMSPRETKPLRPRAAASCDPDSGSPKQSLTGGVWSTLVCMLSTTSNMNAGPHHLMHATLIRVLMYRLVTGANGLVTFCKEVNR
jgi:hypothetical protein